MLIVIIYNCDRFLVLKMENAGYNQVGYYIVFFLVVNFTKQSLSQTTSC
jgi:hypothetical protein